MIYKNNLKIMISFRISSSLFERLSTLAAIRKQSVSDICRYILDEYLRNYERVGSYDSETY